MSSGLLPRGNQANQMTLAGDITCNSLTASSFVSTPALSAGSISVGTINIDNLDINELTFRTTSSGTITNDTAGAGAVLTMPTVTDTLVGRATTDTLSNKTIVSPTITGTGDITCSTVHLSNLEFLAPPLLAGGGDNQALIYKAGEFIQQKEMVSTGDIQTLSNKTITDSTLDGAGNKITNVFTAGGTDYDAVIISSLDTIQRRTVVVPNGTQTLTGKTLISPIIAIIDSGTGSIVVPQGITSTFALQETGGWTAGNLASYSTTAPTPAVIEDSGISGASVVTLSGTQTLSNKTLTGSTLDGAGNKITNVFTAGGSDFDAVIISSLDTIQRRAMVAVDATQTITGQKTFSMPPVISAISNTGTLTLPTTTDTLVGRDTTDTLSNKTLTLPVISSISNGGTVTIPTGTDTLVNLGSSQTLSNKSIVTLTALGTSQSLLDGKLASYFWTATTSGTTPVIGITLSIPTNTIGGVKTYANAYCTAGTHVNTGGVREVAASFKNTSGTSTLITQSTTITQNQGGLNALALTYAASGAGFTVSAVGVAGDTISWSAVTQVFLQ